MTAVSIEEARARLPELIDKVAAGEEVVITRDAQPIAHLVPPSPVRPQPVFGSCKDKLTVVAEDEEHLADFQEYMP